MTFSLEVPMLDSTERHLIMGFVGAVVVAVVISAARDGYKEHCSAADVVNADCDHLAVTQATAQAIRPG